MKEKWIENMLALILIINIILLVIMFCIKEKQDIQDTRLTNIENVLMLDSKVLFNN